ncbi:SigE family RNA polymerase sigma factor [Actinotalea sp. AC32]|nr:SigE family RNA polymerase sigma factor [Actinotalea sp. AC32]
MTPREVHEDVLVTVEAQRPVGRDAEFTTFMAEAAPLLGRMAWLLCGDVHQAEELVQQALVRTYVAWPRARATDPLAYARRTLGNLRIDTWRKRRREVLVGVDELFSAATPSTAQHHADRDALVRALMHLSERRRRVVVLRYLLDLSEREVADDLNISVGTVKSTAARGLAQLRSLLGAEAPAPDATPTTEDLR